MKSGTASSLGCKADFFTDQTLYNAVAPLQTLPKKPLSSYILFSQDERPKVTGLYPSMKVGQVAKELGKRYKSLSESQKQPYVELSQKNSASYKEAMAAFKKTDEGKLFLEESRKKKIEKKMKKSKARITTIKRTTSYPKRSLSMALFLGDHISRSNPNLKITERFGQAILAWKNLSEPNKQLYKNKAEANNKELSQRIGM